MKKEHKMTESAPMYVYATEMVALYYRRLKLKGKKVLTIAGSGDQVLNALFYGAKEVVGFDINQNSLYMTELKISAIPVLSYQEFLRFFSQTKKGFDHVLYVKIRPLLSKGCQKYFDGLYESAGKKELGTSGYFRKRNEFVKNKVKKINAYLADKASYNKMGVVLEHTRPVLFVANVLTLSKSKKITGKKFDVINLSNVPNYLTGRSFGLDEKNVLLYFRTLKKLVAVKGSIIFYSYSDSTYPNPISADVPPISRKSFLNKLKKIHIFNISKQSFLGLVGKRDRITLLGC